MNAVKNPLYEFVGHALATGAGALTGLIQHELMINRLTKDQYIRYIADDKHCIAEAKSLVEHYKSEIASIVEDLKFYDETSKLGELDELDRVEYQGLIEEYEDLKKQLALLVAAMRTKNPDNVRRILAEAWQSARYQAMRNKNAEKHAPMAYAKTVGGALAGGFGYHYAKKGAKILRDKYGAPLVKKVLRRA